MINDDDMLYGGYEGHNKAHKYSVSLGSTESWKWFYAGIGPGYGLTVWALEIGQLTLSWHRNGD